MKSPFETPAQTSPLKQGAPTYDQGGQIPAAQRSRLRSDRNEPQPGPYLKADDATAAEGSDLPDAANKPGG